MANSLTHILADHRGNTVYQKRLKHAVFWLPKGRSSYFVTIWGQKTTGLTIHFHSFCVSWVKRVCYKKFVYDASHWLCKGVLGLTRPRDMQTCACCLLHSCSHTACSRSISEWKVLYFLSFLSKPQPKGAKSP